MATWSYLLGLILIQGCVAVIVDVVPRESIVLPKQNVTFLCKVGVPLQYCRVEIPGLGNFNLNNKLPPKKEVSYYGAGLSAGQCGFTISSVDDRNNGQVKCFMGLETEYSEASGLMRLTVAKAPTAPQLDLRGGSESFRVYKIHDTLHASCLVQNGRPVANISWYLDDEPIIGDGLSMATILDFAKEDLHSKVQNLTRILLPSDNGKMLKCISTHPAIPNGDIAQKQLDVKYPPIPLSNPIDKFGYELGKPGTISVEIDANPKPHFEWIVRDQRIREGSIDSTGRIEAEIAQDLGRGHYIANLRIAAINKQDTETQFILTAYNDMGTQDYTILISTSPEPEGVELGVGAIVGIIASIMVLLVVAFVLIFASRRGRWCCSDPETSRTPPESSDTESAEARPKERKSILPPLKLTKPNINMNLFRKKRDKVANEEEEEVKTMEAEDVKIPLETPKEESKPATNEGIVYAELDLANQNLRPVVRSDDDKTEYAEIVYTPSETGEKKEETVKK